MDADLFQYIYIISSCKESYKISHNT